MITVLAMGQSNAVGWGSGGVWGIPPSVTVWNCAGNSDAGFVGNAFVAPVYGAAPFTAGHNNMMVHACRYLATELGEDVQLILVAYGGQPIQQWSEGPMYGRMEAVLAAAGVDCVDAFLWHQGEANTPTHATYAAAWNTLLGKMTADGVIDADSPIVIGELANQPTAPNMNAVLRSIANASDRIALADIACFTANDQSVDFSHFNGPSLVRAGLEYARELMKLPGPLHHCPDDDKFPYVTAAGSDPYTPTTGNNCAILVKAENGKKSLISGGCFVADRLGVWQFDLSAISYTGSLNILLLDGSGALLQVVAGITTPSVSHFDGSTVIALGKGDKVYMGIVQNAGGAAPTVTQMMSGLLNRMTVKYLGRN